MQQLASQLDRQIDRQIEFLLTALDGITCNMSVPYKKRNSVSPLTYRIDYISNFKFNFFISVVQTRIKLQSKAAHSQRVCLHCPFCIPRHLEQGSQEHSVFLQNQVLYQCTRRTQRQCTPRSPPDTWCQPVVRLWTEELGTQLLSAPAQVRSLPPVSHSSKTKVKGHSLINTTALDLNLAHQS